MLLSIALTTLLVAQVREPSAVAQPDLPPTTSFLQADGPSQGSVLPAAAEMEVPQADTGKSDLMTREQVQAEVKKLAWTKGDIKIVPYGTAWGSASADTQRSKIGDYCLWIESQTMHRDEPDFSVDAKSTRLGCDFFGPPIPCFCDAKVDGKIEVDFQGQFVTRNKPGVLLRHAYVEAKNDDYRLLAGQTWDVISPLGMPILDYTAGSAVGNLAYRRAQFRAERFWQLSDTSMLTLQSSINANVVTDFVSESTTTISADVGPYPDLQVRAAITLGQRTGPDARPVVFGIGAHGGEQDFDFRTTTPIELDVEVPTWSISADLDMPITERFGLQAEFFTGENLSNYMGGILQGVNRSTHRAIHATGGWIDFWYAWRTNLRSHFGFAIDDPLDADLVAPRSVTPSIRTYNRMFYTNLLYDATKNLQLGLEVGEWKTGWMYASCGEAVRIEFATKYRF